MKIWHVMCIVAVLTGCAGPNPNPGERTVDVAWEQSNYPAAFKVLRPAANRGEPWAQLRMGVAYELGSGVTQDIPTAIKWYELAAAQEAQGGWAEGKLVGGSGQSGYFNQNSDALIAMFQLANIYLRGAAVPINPMKVFKLADYVSRKSKGNNLFYCCEFSGGRYIANTAIAETLVAAKQFIQ